MKYTRKFLSGILLSVTMTGMLFLSSCEEEEDPDPDPTVTVEADAGSMMNAGVGEQVVLDGSGSSSSTGSLDYMWEFSSTPSGSSATLSGASTVNATFTPDMEGDYEVQLTVSAEGETDTDMVTVSASQAAASTVEVKDDIDNNTTWTNHVSDPNVPDYHITANIGVNAQLMIEPGVLVHVDEDKGIWVNYDGSLMAEGSAGSEVVMTSSNEAGQLHWKGILVYSADASNKLEHTVIRYAGNSEFNHSGSNYAHAVGVEEGRISLMNTTIEQSAAYGFFHHSGEIGDFSQNHFEANADYSMRIQASQAGKIDNATTFANANNAVNIYESTLEESEETTWVALSADARYFVSGNINVQSYLKIMAGALFDFAENTDMKVYSEGVLVADASGGDQIVFTSKEASSQIYWQGLYINSNDSRNVLNNVEVSFAGNSEWSFSGSDYAAAIGIENGRISVMNTTVSNSKDFGIYFHSGSFIEFSNNSFIDNNGEAITLMMEQAAAIDGNTTFSGNGWDGVTIYSSAMTEEATWAALAGNAQYRAKGWLYAEAGLTMEPGLEIAFDEDEALIIRSTGYLIASGSSGNEILFTSSNEAGQIYWAGIWIQSADARNEINHATVNLAGGYEFNFAGSNYPAAIAGDDDDNPRLTMTNTTVQNSESYAVYWEGGTINNILSISANNSFINNGYDPDVVLP
jgi:hypothetical protein